MESVGIYQTGLREKANRVGRRLLTRTPSVRMNRTSVARILFLIGFSLVYSLLLPGWSDGQEHSGPVVPDRKNLSGEQAREVLQYAGMLHRANLSKIKTWSGSARVLTSNRIGADQLRTSEADVKFAEDVVRSTSKWNWKYTNRESNEGLPKSDLVLLEFRRMIRDGRLYEVAFVPANTKKHFQIKPLFEIRKYQNTEFFVPTWFFRQHGRRTDETLLKLAEADLDKIGWNLSVENELLFIERKPNTENQKSVLVFDLGKAAVLVKYENEKANARLSETMHYQQVDGIWLPRKRVAQSVAINVTGKETKRFSRTITWVENQLNVELAESEFTLAQMGAKKLDVIDETHINAVFPYCKKFDELHWSLFNRIAMKGKKE